MLTLRYRDQIAETDFHWEKLCWIGEIVNIDAAICFRGATVDEAEQEFRAIVDAFLAESDQFWLERDKAA